MQYSTNDKTLVFKNKLKKTRINSLLNLRSRFQLSKQKSFLKEDASLLKHNNLNVLAVKNERINSYLGVKRLRAKQLVIILKKKFPLLFFFLREIDLNWLISSNQILSYRQIETIVYKNFKLFYLYLLKFYKSLLASFKLKETEQFRWKIILEKLRNWFTLHKFYRFKMLQTLKFNIKDSLVIKSKYKLNSSGHFFSSNNIWLSFWKKLQYILPKILNSNNKLKSNVSLESLKYSVKKKPLILWKSKNLLYIKKKLFKFLKTKKFKKFHIYMLERPKPTKGVKLSKYLMYSSARVNKFRLYYTTLGYKQFQNLFLLKNIIKKNTISSMILLLESRLEFFLYRINFVPTLYFSKQLIQSKGVIINKKLITNKNYKIKLFDFVSISNSMFSLVFNYLKFRVFNKRLLTFPKISKLIFNVPLYIEVDFVLLQAQLIKYPNINEIFLPMKIELDYKNRNLSYIYNRF